MIGKTLAHHEITSQPGKGCMGEVYQAKDRKLGRELFYHSCDAVRVASIPDRKHTEEPICEPDERTSIFYSRLF